MFSVPKDKWETKKSGDGTEYTSITEAKLYEGSTVVWGANPDTPTVELKSLYKSHFDNNISTAFERMQKLTKALKKGTFTDEMFPLLELLSWKSSLNQMNLLQILVLIIQILEMVYDCLSEIVHPFRFCPWR